MNPFYPVGFTRGGCPFTEAYHVGEGDDFQRVGGRRVSFVLEYWSPAVYLDLFQQPHYNLSLLNCFGPFCERVTCLELLDSKGGRTRARFRYDASS